MQFDVKGATFLKSTCKTIKEVAGVEINLFLPREQVDLNELEELRGVALAVTLGHAFEQTSLFPGKEAVRRAVAAEAEPAGVYVNPGPPPDLAEVAFFGVSLERYPEEKDAIKTVRKVLKKLWALRSVEEVDERVESLPCTLSPKMARAEAEKLGEELTGLGCDIRLVPWETPAALADRCAAAFCERRAEYVSPAEAGTVAPQWCATHQHPGDLPITANCAVKLLDVPEAGTGAHAEVVEYVSRCMNLPADRVANELLSLPLVIHAELATSWAAEIQQSLQALGALVALEPLLPEEQPAAAPAAEAGAEPVTPEAPPQCRGFNEVNGEKVPCTAAAVMKSGPNSAEPGFWCADHSDGTDVPLDEPEFTPSPDNLVLFPAGMPAAAES